MSKIVLILDDDIVFRQALSLALFKKGFSCIEAKDLEQAESALLKMNVDLFVIDHGLQGGESGFSLLSRATNLDVPSVVVTAFLSEMVSQQAWAQGAFEVFQKPVPLELLVDAISIGCEIGVPVPYLNYQTTYSTDSDDVSELKADLLPTIDPTIVRQMAEFIPLPEINKIRIKLEAQAEEDVSNIRKARQLGDYNLAKEASHRLAGALLNLGLMRCEALSRALESAAGSSHPKCWALLESLVSVKDESLKQLDKAIASLAS